MSSSEAALEKKRDRLSLDYRSVSWLGRLTSAIGLERSPDAVRQKIQDKYIDLSRWDKAAAGGAGLIFFAMWLGSASDRTEADEAIEKLNANDFLGEKYVDHIEDNFTQITEQRNRQGSETAARNANNLAALYLPLAHNKTISAHNNYAVALQAFAVGATYGFPQLGAGDRLTKQVLPKLVTGQ